jgi:hypothetical protein
MASNQLRRENITGEREVQQPEKIPKMTSRVDHVDPVTNRARSHHTVGQMGGGFDSSGQKESYAEISRVADKEALGYQHSGQEQSMMSHGAQGQQRHEQPSSLEEIGKYRAIAQQNSMEALMAAENRYVKAKQSQPQRQGQESTEREQAAEGTVGGYGLKDAAMSAAEKTKDTVVSAAEKARDVAVPAGQTAAQYAGKAADMAVKAGWSTAELTASAAVEGTKMAGNAVQGVAGYVRPTVANVSQKGAEMFNTATNAAVSSGETAKEYAARKKEEAQRDMEKKASKETQGDVTSSRPQHDYSTRGETEQVEGGGGVLEAVGETVVEIGQTAKDLVTGKGVVASEEDQAPRTREDKNKQY